MRKNQTITINGTGKVAVAEISIQEDEVNVNNLTIYTKGQVFYYSCKQCAKHQWLLYNVVAPQIEDFAYTLRRVMR